MTADFTLASSCSETKRLVIKDSVIEECELLQKVNEASDYISDWVGWKTPENYAYLTLTQGNLPPDGKKENFRSKTIYLKGTDEIIGVFEFYFGYPCADILALGWLFIVPEHQKKGYAKEAVTFALDEARRLNYKKVRLGVRLKNWPALRFWTKIGFDKIIDIVGDKLYSEKSSASVILEKVLD